MTIVSENGNGTCMVAWSAFDGHERTRSFDTRSNAERFAAQLACRLEIDAYAEDLRRHANVRDRRVPPSGDVFSSLLRAATEKERLAVVFAALTGTRPAQQRTLRWRDMNFGHPVLGTDEEAT